MKTSSGCKILSHEVRSLILVFLGMIVVMGMFACTPPTAPAPKITSRDVRVDIKCNGSWSGSNWGKYWTDPMSGTYTQYRVTVWGTENESADSYYGAAARFTTGSFVQIELVCITRYDNLTSNVVIKKSVATNVAGDYVSTVVLQSEL